LARGAWPILAACYVVIAAVSVFQADRHFTRHPCGYDVVWCVKVEAWLESVKISTAVVGAVYAATVALPALIFIALGCVLWWKARGTRTGLVFAYILVAMWMSDITNVSVSAMWLRFWRMDETSSTVPYTASYFARALFALAMISVVSFTLCFPTGRVVPRWTRWMLLAWAVITLLHELVPSESAWQYNNWPRALNAVITLGVPIAGVVSLAYRYRVVADERERQQMRWIVPSAITVGLVFVTYELLESTMQPKVLFEDTLRHFFLQTGANVALALTSSLLGVSIVTAILQRRLFDITLVVNRALVFGSLTTVVVGLYVVVVAGVNALLKTTNPLFGSVIATAFVAIVFQPLYRRLQRAVNRLMYGERDDPYTILTELSRRLETAGTPDDVLHQIVTTVGTSLKLPYVAIQLQGDARLQVAFGAPTATEIRFPLIHQNERVGDLILAPRSSETQFGKTEVAVLNELARAAGMAAYAARKTLDLRASRERLVTSREEERRRLHRDLHDGLGPVLASTILGLDKARRLVGNGILPNATNDAHKSLLAVLNELKTQTQTAMQDVRGLVYELRPPVLDELGLVNALRAHADRIESALEITLHTPATLPKLSAAIEVATYRIVQEAVNNVLRHAEATQCDIRLKLESGTNAGSTRIQTWVIEVRDNGRGLPNDYRVGVGLASIRERAEELGGTCQVERLDVDDVNEMGGTLIFARLPLPQSLLC